MRKRTEAQWRELLAEAPYVLLASEVGRRNVARRKNAGRKPVMYECVCGWIGNATEARKHSCDVKKIVKRVLHKN